MIARPRASAQTRVLSHLARLRAYRMNLHSDSSADASLYANYCIAGKLAHLQGVIKYWWNRLWGRKSKLIEYKGADAARAADPAVANGGGA